MKILKGILKKRNIFKQKIVKVIGVFLFGLLLIEGFLCYLEKIGYLGEPYEWGNRNDIAFKINDCKQLFNSPDNKGKIRIIIIGDSVAESAFNPEIIDDLFKQKTISYNLAFPGTAIRTQSILIEEVIIPKIKPDIIIWDVPSPNVFVSEKDERENLTLTKPMGRYYTNNIDGLNNEELCNYYLLKFSRLYRYRENLRPSVFQEEQNRLDFYHSVYLQGWRKHDSYLNNGYSNDTYIDPYPFDFNKESQEIFFDTLKLIKKKTDYFLVVFAPYYKKIVSNEILYSMFYKLESKNFLDLNGKEELFQKFNWMDVQHLNINGSVYYTSYTHEKIKNNFKFS